MSAMRSRLSTTRKRTLRREPDRPSAGRPDRGAKFGESGGGWGRKGQVSGHDLDSSERGDAASVPSDDPTVQLSRGRMAAAQRNDSTTEVMSLDELMDLAASRPATSAPAEQ